MPWLTTEGATHQLDGGDTVVGSGPHAGWRLEKQELAARHFVVSKSGNAVTIRASTVDAIVAVNGRRVGMSAVELRDGDMVDAGSARFSYSTGNTGAVAAVKVPAAHIVEVRGGFVHPLTASSTTIGRDKTNAILVRDPTASRFHAEVRREAGGYVLHPHGSSGTRVNGRGLASAERLEDGDTIEIGHVEMKFVLGPAPQNAAKAPAPNADDMDRSHRRTIMASAVMDLPKEPVPAARSNTWIWVALVVLIAGMLYLGLK